MAGIGSSRLRRLLAVTAMVAAACSNKTLPDSVLAGATPDDIGSAATGDETVAGGGPAAAGGASGGSATVGTGTATGGGPGGAETGATGGARRTGAATTTNGATTASAVGVTRTSIKISVSAPFSGVYAPFYNEYFKTAIQTWEREINAAGGIHGRKVTFVKVDNEFRAEGAAAACKEVESNGTFMSMMLNGFTAEVDCEDAAGIPVFSVAMSDLKPWRNVVGALYTPLLAPADVSFLKSSHVNGTGKRIGLVYDTGVPYHERHYRAIATEMKKQGLDLVHVEEVGGNQASFVAEMQRMDAARADVVVLIVGLEAPGIIRDAKAIGFNPQWYASSSSAAGSDIGAKAGNDNFQGMLGLRPFLTTEAPAFARYRETVRKHHGDTAAAAVTDVHLGFYSWSDILGRMLRDAGPNPTRPGFVAAAKAIENYDNGMGPPFSLKGREFPVGHYAVFPARCCASDYTWRVLGPAAERF